MKIKKFLKNIQVFSEDQNQADDEQRDSGGTAGQLKQISKKLKKLKNKSKRKSTGRLDYSKTEAALP